MSGKPLIIPGRPDPYGVDPYDFLVLDDLTEEESKVLIYWIDPNQGVVTTPFAHSLARNCANMGQRVLGIIRLGGAHQTEMRNEAIRSFLDMPEEPEWLLSWDTDMELHDAKSLRRLIGHAEHWNARIATCLGFMQRPDMLDRPEVPWMPSPNMMMYDEDTEHYWMKLNYQPNTPQWCDATGMGFTLMHRTLLEDMDDPWHEYVDGYGHDVYFCHKARTQFGDRTLYCTDIKSGHWKTFPLDEPLFDRAWAGFDKPEGDKGKDNNGT